MNFERPYEKLENKGPEYLSVAELMAIILRTGTRKKNATHVSSEVLKLHPDGLKGIHQLNLEDLKKVDGIGRVKAIQIKALGELAKRLSKQNASIRFKADSPKAISDLYMEEMRYLKQEHFKVVLLNTKNQIIHEKDLFIGTVNASIVDTREIFIYALRHEAVKIILLHNHPSGDPRPSPEDINMTNRCVKASKLLGIEVLDHIIIGDNKFYSLRTNNKM